MRSAQPLFLRCRHAERYVEHARKDRSRRTAGRVVENLAAASRVAAIQQALNEPCLRAVASPGEPYGVLQRRRRPTNRVLIRLARVLVEHGEVGAIPLHRARKHRRVARFDRYTFAAALRKLNERETPSGRR